jgi:hypothetical protein
MPTMFIAPDLGYLVVASGLVALPPPHLRTRHRITGLAEGHRAP